MLPIVESPRTRPRAGCSWPMSAVVAAKKAPAAEPPAAPDARADYAAAAAAAPPPSSRPAPPEAAERGRVVHEEDAGGAQRREASRGTCTSTTTKLISGLRPAASLAKNAEWIEAVAVDEGARRGALRMRAEANEYNLALRREAGAAVPGVSDGSSASPRTVSRS